MSGWFSFGSTTEPAQSRESELKLAHRASLKKIVEKYEALSKITKQIQITNLDCESVWHQVVGPIPAPAEDKKKEDEPTLLVPTKNEVVEPTKKKDGTVQQVELGHVAKTAFVNYRPKQWEEIDACYTNDDGISTWYTATVVKDKGDTYDVLFDDLNYFATLKQHLIRPRSDSSLVGTRIVTSPDLRVLLREQYKLTDELTAMKHEAVLLLKFGCMNLTTGNRVWARDDLDKNAIKSFFPCNIVSIEQDKNMSVQAYTPVPLIEKMGDDAKKTNHVIILTSRTTWKYPVSMEWQNILVMPSFKELFGDDKIDDTLCIRAIGHVFEQMSLFIQHSAV